MAILVLYLFTTKIPPNKHTIKPPQTLSCPVAPVHELHCPQRPRLCRLPTAAGAGKASRTQPSPEGQKSPRGVPPTPGHSAWATLSPCADRVPAPQPARGTASSSGPLSAKRRGLECRRAEEWDGRGLCNLEDAT